MIVAIIQARMGSLRLPGKVLKKVLGKTLLEHLILRVKRARELDKIIVATTTSKKDAPIATLATRCGVGCFRGSENDVLDRYYQSAKKARAKTVVRLTGDCPLMDPKVIDQCVDFFVKNDCDYISNVEPPTFPDGMDVEVFSFAALETTWREAALPSEREHVTPYMRHSGKFRTKNLRNSINLSSVRLTVDEKRDVILIKKLMNFFMKQRNLDFGLKEITALWKKTPGFFLDNQNIKRNEGYLKSLMEDTNTASSSMHVLLLGSDNPECEKLLRLLQSSGEKVHFTRDKQTPEKVHAFAPDIIISYNHAFILKPDILTIPRLGTINLHISYLPWNRGADPNLWSHLEQTPSGVSIHYIDEGVDTGDIIGQREVKFSKSDTLKTSYAILHEEIRHLFEKLWPRIKTGTAPRVKQIGTGTVHWMKDKERFAGLWREKGYDTPIRELSARSIRHKERHL